MSQHTTVARLARKTVFTSNWCRQGAGCDEVSAGFAHAAQVAIPDDGTWANGRVCVRSWNVRVPAGQIFAVEQAPGWFRRVGGVRECANEQERKMITQGIAVLSADSGRNGKSEIRNRE